MPDTAVLDINPEMINELVLRELAKDRQRPAIVAQAQPPESHGPGSSLALGAALGGAAADTATTLYAQAHGYHEGNPLYKWAGDKGAMPVMLGIDAAAYYGLKKILGDQHPKLLDTLLTAAGASHSLGAVHNLRVMSKYGDQH